MRRLRVAVVAVLALAGAGIALTLTPSTAVDTFVSSSSADYAATQTTNSQFGSDPVVVLVQMPLTSLIQQSHLETLSRLEACLAGQQLRLDRQLAAYVPVAAARAQPYGGASSPCGQLMRMRAAKVVYGPATFLNHAIAAINTEIGSLTHQAADTIRAAEQEARKLARRRGLDTAQTNAAVQAAGQLALQRQLAAVGDADAGSVLAGVPSITDQTFLRQIVFGSTTASTPAARFSYLFPTSDAAVIQVRLRAGLSDSQQQQAIGLIRSAVAMPRFHLPGATYTVTGEPVLLSDLSGEIGSQLGILLAVAVAVMGLVLIAIFRRRLRLLPLVFALAAVAITFGLTAVAGGRLTVAEVAVFPVLVGLGVDYGVQFRSGTPRGAIAIAALATAVAFLALLVSPVPMVRGFGVLLIVGVAVAFAVILTSVPPGAGRRLPPPRLPGTFLASVAGAGEILRGGLPVLVCHPRRVLALALVLAAAGWVLEGHTAVQSDITRLVPSGMPALRHLDTLERVTGTSGQINVLVSAPDVTTKRVVAWMRSYERSMSERFGAGNACGSGSPGSGASGSGVSGSGSPSLGSGAPGGSGSPGSAGCAATATLCPALSLPSLLTTAGGSLSAVPGYFQRAVLTADHRYALLSFGIRLMPLSRQRRVVEQMRAALADRDPASAGHLAGSGTPGHLTASGTPGHLTASGTPGPSGHPANSSTPGPPPGVTAQLAGLPVLAADADGSLSSVSARMLMLVVSLVVVGLALLAALRRPRRALVPLIPIVFATGWSALLVYALRIPLNPMSATLGTLVIAITTEFSVLLSERVCRQLGQGMTLMQALDDAYRTTGVAVLTSAITAIAGFGVLVVSNITMLRDFGVLTLVDLSVSLLGVMLVLPATLGLIDLRPRA